MSVTWTISVGGRSYGPYTLEQMKAFQAEGRLAPHSLVARGGEEQGSYASEDAELALLFRVAARPQSCRRRTRRPSRTAARPRRTSAATVSRPASGTATSSSPT